MEHVYEQIRARAAWSSRRDDQRPAVWKPSAMPISSDDREPCAGPTPVDENLRGTNAIGTALSEEMPPVAVLGSEHFLEYNGC